MSIYTRKTVGIVAAVALILATLGLASSTATADSYIVATSSTVDGLAAYSGTVPSGVMPDSPGALSCSHKHSKKSHTAAKTTKNNVKIRKGPHTTCKSLGLADKSDKLELFCYLKPKGEKYPWVWLRDHGPNINGWIRWDYLKYSGKVKRC